MKFLLVALFFLFLNFYGINSQFTKAIPPLAFFDLQVTVKVGQESKIFSFNLNSDTDVDVLFMTNQQFVDFELLYAAGKPFKYEESLSLINTKSYTVNSVRLSSTSYIVILNRKTTAATVTYLENTSTFITKSKPKFFFF
jgi:hypothetical protein